MNFDPKGEKFLTSFVLTNSSASFTCALVLLLIPHTNLPVESPPNPSTSNPKRRNQRRSKQPFILEESPVDTMVDQRTMAELLRAACRWLEKEPSRSILTWDDLVSKFINEFFPPKEQHISVMKFQAFNNELHQLDTLYNALNPIDQDSLNSAAGGNLLERPKLTHAVNQQTSAVTTTMTVILKQFLATPPSAFVKAVKEIYVTYSGAHPSGSLPTNTISNPKGELKAITTRSGIVLNGPSVPIPPPFINPEEDERVENTLTDQDLPEYTIKEKLLELANTPLIENCLAVILKKLPEKLGDPGKFLIPCGFSKLKCKALGDLGASINLMPLTVWKKLGLPELISTHMTLELANRAICTPAKIARDVFVPVGKFTFPADFVIVDYERDPRMILHDGDERLTLNMRHDTSSYSNKPQKESINMINISDDSSEDFLENLFSTNHQSGNPTFSPHPNLTSLEVKDDVFNLEGDNVLPKKMLDLDSTKDLHPSPHINQLSGSTTSSSSSPNHLLEEFADKLALITFPSGNDYLHLDIESDLKEIEYLLHHDLILEDSVDQSNLVDLNDNLVHTMPEMFTIEHALDYSSPPLYDEYDDDLFEVESDTKYVYDDSFDSKGEKIKESKLLIDELDLSSDFLLPSEYESFLSEDFFQDKNAKKLAISHAYLILEDFDYPLYELPCFKEVPRSKIILLFSFKNEEKVFKLEILTSKEVHSSLILELSHQGYKVFKINQIPKILMKIFLFSCGENIRILDVPCLYFYLP
nr:reverse transcriptase domain-containing protein [Tanacetum cinerariifolium]